MPAPIAPDLAAASCLAMMRAGEQSAADAFARIMARLTRGEHARAAGVLAPLLADEQRHDELLAFHAAALPVVRVDHDARRFFRRLETRDPGVHLARIAALDACACQILARMVTPIPRARLRPNLVNTLISIRRDEGFHVRQAHELALELGVEPLRMREIGSAVRRSFAVLLASRAPHFEALGVDCPALIQCIEREY